MASTTARYVFISYARPDAAAAAAIEEALRGAGLRVFRDHSDIAHGDNWDLEIEQALADAHVMVLLLSPHSMPYRKEVYREWFAFDQKAKPLVPVLLEDCTLHSRLLSVNYLDARAGVEVVLPSVVAAVQQAQAPAQRASRTPRQRRRLLLPVLAAVLLLLMGLGGAAAWAGCFAPEGCFVAPRAPCAGVEVCVAVAVFEPAPGSGIREVDARAFAEQVYSNLDVALRDAMLDANLPLSLGSVPPRVVGTVGNETGATVAAANTGAALVLYGTLSRDERGQLAVTPRFYAAPSTFAEAYELGGTFRLGAALPLGTSLDNVTFSTNIALRGRLRAITQVFTGLSYYVAEDYDSALATFETVNPANWGTAAGQDTMRVLTGNARLRLASQASLQDDLGQAQSYLDAALADYTRAKQDSPDYARVYVALASATHLQWNFDARRTNTYGDAQTVAEGLAYSDQARTAPDAVTDVIVGYHSDFARLQLLDAALIVGCLEAWTQACAAQRTELEGLAGRILRAQDDGVPLLYLAAEAHWYLGEMSATWDGNCAAALPHYTRALTAVRSVAGQVSRLRELVFGLSAAHCAHATGDDGLLADLRQRAQTLAAQHPEDAARALLADYNAIGSAG